MKFRPLEIPGPRGRALCCAALALFAAGCGAPEKAVDTSAPAPALTALPLPPPVAPSFTPDLAAARESRDNLVPFYLRTFDALLQSEHFPREMEITRYDQLAHRLWIPEHTTSRQIAIETLSRAVRHHDSSESADKEPAEPARTARIKLPYFGDPHQFHRDQYAMIMSETGIADFGGSSAGQFAFAAQWDWGQRKLSVRDDLPWTVTLLSRFTPPGTRWTNGAGKSIGLDELLRAMVTEVRLTPPDNPTVCYHAHKAYAAAATVAAGYEDFRADANRLLADEIRRAREVCEAMQGVDRSAARVKMYGHLIEALYRGGERVFHLADYQQDVSFMLAAMLEESRALRSSPMYQGPFDIFTGAPHAIHGLDLLLAAHAAPPPAQ